jgi:hypothetical protein
VVTIESLSVCPFAPTGALVIANLTFTPCRAFPNVSVTDTTNGRGKVVLTGAVWELPAVEVRKTGRPAIAVAVKLIGLPASEPDEAVTMYVPTFVPKVSAVEASPSALVRTRVSDRVVPTAPLGVLVSVNRTCAPENGVPYWLRTVTTNG